MADNTTLAGGDIIRDLARQAGTIKTQTFQLDLGGATGNAENLISAGQKTMANSVPVVLASDQTAVPISDPDIVATGTIMTTDLVVAAPGGAGAFVTGTSTATSYINALAPGGDRAWNLQITGLTSGTLYFEISLDSTNGIDGQWINVNGRQTGVVNTVLAGNATTNGMYRGNTSGAKYYRVRSVGTLVGTPAIVIRLAGGIGAIFLNASIPAGTNLIGYVAGPAGAALALDGTDISAPTAMPAGGVGIRGWLSAIWTKLNGTVNVLLQAGSAIVGKVGIDQTTPGTTNLVALAANQTVNISQTNGVAPLMGNGVSGTGSQRVNIASDNTAFAVNATLSAETTKVIGTVNPPGVTKSTQGTVGFTTQPLRDAGRVNVAMTCYQAAGILTTEALFAAATFSISRDGAAATTGQQLAVTAGKRFRIQSIVVCVKNTAAAAGTSKLVLRYLAAGGTITNASPILAILDMGTNGTVAAAYIDPTEMSLPDGIELIASSTFGFTSLCNAVTMLHTITVNGFEY